MVNHLGIALISFIFSATLSANAQSSPSSTATDTNAESAGAPAVTGAAAESEVEALYDKDDAKPAPKAKKDDDKQTKDVKPAVDVQNLSDLAKLAPFEDVAVIQRRFLPKSSRFEATVGLFTNMNNPFFSAYGLQLMGAYYLTERWAIQAMGSYAASSGRQVTDDLEKHRNITTNNQVTARSFMGAAVKWNPIYGKITLLNKSIVPFDLNFDVGGGMTGTVDGQSVFTLHAGTSQVFAYSKSTAFRWDFSMNRYTANSTPDKNGKKSQVSQFDLYLGIGVSFYFPEASYR